MEASNQKFYKSDPQDLGFKFIEPIVVKRKILLIGRNIFKENVNRIRTTSQNFMFYRSELKILS